jgi:hypothetical protein
VVSYKEKDQWELVPKYNIGKKSKWSNLNWQ